VKDYCLGFGFDYDGDVLLIRKNKPAWMAGKLNGLGGAVEPGETPRDAMVREFNEECGILTRHEDWTAFAVMEFPKTGDRVFCFASILQGIMDGVYETTTAELVNLFEQNIVRFNDALPNLKWLVPLAWASVHNVGGWESPLIIRP